MKIRALNEPEASNSTSAESYEDDGRNQTLSKEASEEQCFEKYQAALIAIQEMKIGKAQELLEELSSELKNVPNDCEILIQLRFSVLKNLGNLQDDNIDNYLDALVIDSSDISLWIKTGDRAMKLSNFALARQCYEQALGINPNNWVAIDRLIELYYILHLPLELYDICLRALNSNGSHKKAREFLEEAARIQPSLVIPSKFKARTLNNSASIESLSELKTKRRADTIHELQKFKRARLGITLDTARTQSLSSFGNYIVKIYERFSKQCITRNTVIDLTLNNSFTFSQQLSNGSVNSQSNNQNSNGVQNSSQDVEMVAIEGEGTSISDNDKSENRTEQTTSNDDHEQNKSNSRNRLNHTYNKSSSLSFAAMLFPMDIGDKRRSSRNKSNHDDTFSFKMKFDELNELLPESLRIGAIEEALQRRREEQQKNLTEENNDKKDETTISVETNFEPTPDDVIIKEIIEAISSHLRANNTGTKHDIKLCDIFRLYLSKLSARKHNTLPEAYVKIYKFYRKLCPILNDAFVEIGAEGITLDELWFTLTANEITYQNQECLFLLRMMEQLRTCIDEAQHREFLVRLFLILGLHSDHRYLEAALENIEENVRIYASNRKIITRAHIKTLIDCTNERLQQEKEDADNSIDIINRLAPKSENEMSEREIGSLCKAIQTAKLWQRGLDILNQRINLDMDVIIDTLNMCLKNGAKMDAILASKLCKDAISSSRPTTWTCLYRGWIDIMVDDEMMDEDVLKRLDKFFELGHQALGKKNCCTVDEGEFLMLYVKHLLIDDRDSFEERELLGALNCLFGYPAKKPASVATHKANRVPMRWEYVEVVYHYFEPEELPTYMSLLRKKGISSEMEPLFREIASCVPKEYHPENSVNVIDDYINNGTDLTAMTTQQHNVTKDIYYFLADYYFKNKDFATAERFYNYDLVINPNRFDSWAASGLIRANGIDKAMSCGQVSSRDFISGPFRRLTDSALRCFTKATNMNPNESKATLWIEFGNISYTLTALSSRLFFYDDFEREISGTEKDRDLFDKLEERHRYLYGLAKNCFKSANRLCHSEEIWLQYYMLGKIYEKVDTFRALDYYQKADTQLFLEGASYPKRISYYNPPELAYEAMEVHYRIHSCALKFLLDCHEVTQEHMDRLKRYLMNAARSPFVVMESLPDPKKDIMDESSISRDVTLLLNDQADSINKSAEFDELIFLCLHGMKRCLVRCDKNFKALYRLAYYYRSIMDPKMAQDIMMAKDLRTDRRIQNLMLRNPGIPEFRAAPPDLSGHDSLFKDRKMCNMFYNIWRIPVEEVDRPGSFEHWMFKCTQLFIKTCIDLNDTNALAVITFHLSRQPQTSKRYLHDRPRHLLGLYAVNAIIKIVLKAIGQSVNAETQRSLLREGMLIADKFVKANVFTDKMRDLFNRLQAMTMEISGQTC